MIAVSWGATQAPEKKATDHIFLREIAEQVCKKHCIRLMDFYGQRRTRTFAWARQEAYWRARNETTASYPEIGKAFGNRDHCTVIKGIRRYEERMSAIRPEMILNGA